MRAVGVLAGVRHLVEIGRLEGQERALARKRRRGGRVGGRQHVDGDASGLLLLQEAAQDRGAAGAKQFDADAGLRLEQLRRRLGGLDRSRRVPDHLSFALGRRKVGLLREGRER